MNFEIVKFIVTGWIVVGTQHALLYSMRRWGFFSLRSSSNTAMILSSLLNFFLQKAWAFGAGKSGKDEEEFFWFAISTIAFTLANTWMLELFVKKLKWHENLCQLLVNFILGIISYFVSKSIFGH